MSKINFLLLSLLSLTLTSCSLFKTQSTMQKKSDAMNDGSSNFQSMLGQNQSMECSYDMNGRTVTAMVKGDKYKIIGTSYMNQDQNGGMVSDGTYAYMWDETTQKGTKYELAVVQNLNQSDSETPDTTPEPAIGSFDMQKWTGQQDEKYQVKCDPKEIADSEFIPPTNIVFTDITQSFIQMDEMTDKMKVNPNQMPTSDEISKLNELMLELSGQKEPESMDESMTEEQSGERM